MGNPFDLAIALAIFFSVVRVIAAIAGLWYQADVTWNRYHEKRELCANPSSNEVECAILTWHFERGVLLLVAHVLLDYLTFITIWLRSRMPVPEVLEFEALLIRASIDLAFTGAVVILAVISFRAHIHHDRHIRLLRQMARRIRSGQLGP